MFSKSILDEVRDRISIVAYIGERIPLKRAGRNFKGLCPFHREKTPSFNVSDEKQIFHCFGCGEGGDIFKFVMKFDGMDFSEAVRYLAGVAGVELPRDERAADPSKEEGRAKRKRFLLRTNEIARDFFMGLLNDSPTGEIARRYLQHRGIPRKIWEQHFLGFADNSWESLTSHLEAKGVPMDLAQELGLVRRRDGGGHYDFFRNRLIFPIVSPRGEVLGFGGRAIGEGEGDGVAKYMNSPDSMVYHKSSCVYGLDRSASSIRNEDAVVLVEGYMDFIALHQAGITNAVAPLGTALTEGHVRLLSRYSRNMVLVFDGDEAGSRAALRSLGLFIDAGLMPRVLPLPDGDDPDSFVRKAGASEFRSRLKEAGSLFEFFIDRTAEETGMDAAGRVQAVSRVVPYLRMFKDPVERGVYSRAAASRLGVDEGDVARAVGSRSDSYRNAIRALPGACEGDSGGPFLSAERILVRTMLKHPEMISGIFDRVDADCFRNDWCRTVAELLKEVSSRVDDVQIGDILEQVGDAELAAQLRQIAMDDNWCDEEDLGDLIRDCTDNVKNRPRVERLQAINDEIRRAEIEGDERRLFELLKEKKELALQKHA